MWVDLDTDDFGFRAGAPRERANEPVPLPTSSTR